jgi:hypothetical protein
METSKQIAVHGHGQHEQISTERARLSCYCLFPLYATEKEALVGSKRKVRKLAQVNGSHWQRRRNRYLAASTILARRLQRSRSKTPQGILGYTRSCK